MVVSDRLSRLSLVLICQAAFGVGVGFGSEPRVPSADELIQRAVAHAEQVDAAAGAFAYKKVSVVEELDSVGKVKERKERVYLVSYKAGITHARLLEVNGHLPAGGDL